MKHIYTLGTSVVAGLGIAFGATVLTSSGASAPRDIAPVVGNSSVVEEAEKYVGDPWEQRFREQFWADQHIHDSWNGCHLGEHASDELRRFSGC